MKITLSTEFSNFIVSFQFLCTHVPSFRVHDQALKQKDVIMLRCILVVFPLSSFMNKT